MSRVCFFLAGLLFAIAIGDFLDGQPVGGLIGLVIAAANAVCGQYHYTQRRHA